MVRVKGDLYTERKERNQTLMRGEKGPEHQAVKQEQSGISGKRSGGGLSTGTGICSVLFLETKGALDGAGCRCPGGPASVSGSRMPGHRQQIQGDLPHLREPPSQVFVGLVGDTRVQSLGAFTSTSGESPGPTFPGIGQDVAGPYLC